MIRTITSREELHNVLALKFDVWAVGYEYKGAVTFFDNIIAGASIVQGTRGPKLKFGAYEIYLVRCGIEDHNCHHSVYVYGHRRFKLFNSYEDADKWRKMKGVRR